MIAFSINIKEIWNRFEPFNCEYLSVRYNIVKLLNDQ